jgi:hypothetical protein
VAGCFPGDAGNIVRAESYVVRIYRRGHANRRSIIGVIEAVHTGWQKPFQSLQELADILARPGRRSRPRAVHAIDDDSGPSTQRRKP